MSSPTRQDLIWADVRRRPDDRRPPAAVVVGATLMLELLWVGLARTLLSPVALTVGVVVLTTVASVWLTLPATLGQALVSFLVVDGFVEGSYGTLGWHGTYDLMLFTALLLLSMLAAESAYEVRWSKPDRAAPGRRPPWWHDDDLVELSLGLPDLPEVHPTTDITRDDDEPSVAHLHDDLRTDAR
jgi:hypothetical protein